MLSQLMDRVKESETMRMSAAAFRLREKGIEIVNLGVGEPDFNTPDHIKESAKNAIDLNFSHYTMGRGILKLREAAAGWLQREFDVNYTPDEIIISNGAKQAIFNAVLALINPGDEVIIPTPCWPTYVELVKLAGATPVIIKTDLTSKFKITAEQLEKAISSKTKAFIFSNPSNPTGITYEEDELSALVSVFKKHKIFVFSDEIYAKLTYDNCKFISMAAYRTDLEDRVILFQGVSKAFAMTGWRLGFAAGPSDFINACDIIQGHSTSSVSTISQYAALEAFNGVNDDFRKMCQQFLQRKIFVSNFLKTIADLEFCEPNGAFYFFPKIDSFYGKSPDGSIINNSTDLAIYLLTNAHVSVVPGNGFFREDYLRISYGTGINELKKGLEAIKTGLNKIQRM